MGSVGTLPFSPSYDQTAVAQSSGLLVYSYEFVSSNSYDAKFIADRDDVYFVAYNGTDGTLITYNIAIAALTEFRMNRVVIGTSSADWNVYPHVTTNDQDILNIGARASISFAVRTGDGSVATCSWGAVDPYPDEASALSALRAIVGNNPITYRLTNCSAPGAPSEATSGSTVTVNLSPSPGYSFLNPQSDIYVTNNGVAVVSSYANGVLHFTMP